VFQKEKKMAFQLSPGVNVTEKDITLIVPAVATTPAGMVAPFQWGPANEPTLITSEKQLATTFGSPVSSIYDGADANYATYWFTASNFLSYGNNLTIVRALNENYHTSVNEEALNSNDDGIPVTETAGTGIWTGVFNDASYEAYTFTSAMKWCARFPGDLGNDVEVIILDASYSDEIDTAGNKLTKYLDEFDTTPGTSLFFRDLGFTSANDELHILVIDGSGKWTGEKGTVLERFAYVSKCIDARKPDGTNNYYVNVVNNNSKYIRWAGHALTVAQSGKSLWGKSYLDFSSGGIEQFSVLTNEFKKYILKGGSLEGSLWSNLDLELISFYEQHFADSETNDASLLLAGPMSAAAARDVIEIAEARKDCIAFVSPKSNSIETLSIEDIISYKNSVNLSSSYGVMDSGYKLQYDRYNDVFRYVPLCADVAGCCVTTDLNRDPWFSPAGFDRGRIKNVVRLAFNPNKTQRDELYRRGINPVVSFQGQGTVLFGDKTMLDRPSAFDRINVRRLFIVLEKAISTASKFLLFEFNDEFTRAQFRNLVEPYLRDVQGRRGITDFRVVCDETNNTAQVIDSNSFVGDIYIKPARSINFIQLNFIATPTGVSFEEIQGV